MTETVLYLYITGITYLQRTEDSLKKRVEFTLCPIFKWMSYNTLVYAVAFKVYFGKNTCQILYFRLYYSVKTG